MSSIKLLDDVKRTLKEISSSSIVSGPDYVALQKECGKLYLDNFEELEAIYHLSEAHGYGLRQQAMLEFTRLERKEAIEYLSTGSEKYAKLGSKGLLKRLEDLPPEWTIVQITREFDPLENVTPRREGSGTRMKNFHVVRFPCGPLDCEVPFCVDCFWPDDYDRDPIDVFCEIKKKWSIQNSAAANINKIRKQASDLAESYCLDLTKSCFKTWRVALLGKLLDGDLQDEIRIRLNYIFEKHSNKSATISIRQRYLTYLIAEGSAVLTDVEVDEGLIEVFPEDESIRDSLFDEILAIRTCYTQLSTAKRHSVILILDNHLDLIPWEIAEPFRYHPYSRMPSIHFVHYYYYIHRSKIKEGLLEMPEEDVCFYVLDPENDLPSEKMKCYLKKRFPSWIGIINQPPTSNQIVEALSNYKLFMYCGHGSGSQYLQSQSVAKLNISQSQHFLIGCSSSALKDHGGDMEMTGDILQYIVAGSACTVGILWSITSNDADLMTMELLNCLLTGPQINPSSLREMGTTKDAELLRALCYARDGAKIFSNKASFIARGLPTKVVSNTHNINVLS